MNRLKIPLFVTIVVAAAWLVAAPAAAQIVQPPHAFCQCKIGCGCQIGTSGVDNMLGGDGCDSLCGLGGGDTLNGGGGDDRFDGGNGDDYLDGDFGFDVLNGGAGTDICVNGEVVTNCP